MPETIKNATLYSPLEVSEVSREHYHTIRRRILDAELKSIKLGPSMFIEEDEFIRYIKEKFDISTAIAKKMIYEKLNSK